MKCIVDNLEKNKNKNKKTKKKLDIIQPFTLVKREYSNRSNHAVRSYLKHFHTANNPL